MAAKDERQPLLADCCKLCNSPECGGCPWEKTEKVEDKGDGGEVSFTLSFGTYAKMRVERKTKRWNADCNFITFCRFAMICCIVFFFRHDKRNSGWYCRIFPGYSREESLHTPLCHIQCGFDAFMLCSLTQLLMDSLVKSGLERVAQAHWWKTMLKMWPRREIR